MSWFNVLNPVSWVKGSFGATRLALIATIAIFAGFMFATKGVPYLTELAGVTFDPKVMAILGGLSTLFVIVGLWGFRKSPVVNGLTAVVIAVGVGVAAWISLPEIRDPIREKADQTIHQLRDTTGAIIDAVRQ